MKFLKENCHLTEIRLLLLLSALLFSLTGCSAEAPAPPEDNISVYYINKAETKITPVSRKLESTDKVEQAAEAIEALKENPVELSLRTPVNGYEINSWEIRDTLLILDLNTDYKKIQPTTEVLIRAALVRTMIQIPGIDHVEMRINGETLTDSLGVTIGPMTAEQFIDNAGNEINAYEKARLKLYFANEAGDKLVEYNTQPVVYNSNISMEKLVVEQLIAGPEAGSEEAFPVLNPGIKVLGVTVKDGTCYVNLDDKFMTQMYNVTGEVVIYSIVNSLAELPNINKVQIAVNGETTNVVYRETFALSTVFDRNLDLVYGTEKE